MKKSETMLNEIIERFKPHLQDGQLNYANNLRVQINNLIAKREKEINEQNTNTLLDNLHNLSLFTLKHYCVKRDASPLELYYSPISPITASEIVSEFVNEQQNK